MGCLLSEPERPTSTPTSGFDHAPRLHAITIKDEELRVAGGKSTDWILASKINHRVDPRWTRWLEGSGLVERVDVATHHGIDRALLEFARVRFVEPTTLEFVLSLNSSYSKVAATGHNVETALVWMRQPVTYNHNGDVFYSRCETSLWEIPEAVAVKE